MKEQQEEVGLKRELFFYTFEKKWNDESEKWESLQQCERSLWHHLLLSYFWRYYWPTIFPHFVSVFVTKRSHSVCRRCSLGFFWFRSRSCISWLHHVAFPHHHPPLQIHSQYGKHRFSRFLSRLWTHSAVYIYFPISSFSFILKIRRFNSP